MALMRRIAKVSFVKDCLHFSKIFQPCSTTIRHAGYWNKDWRPGPYPRTEEERRAAAKKYNMIPEDYEPYDENDVVSYNDYPKLPLRSTATKDPYVNWDFPHMRRNYGEPMHVDADVLTEDKWTPDERQFVSFRKMFFSFFGVVFGMWIFILAGPKDGLIRDLKPRQIWSPGAVHYSFELEGSGHHH